MKSRSYATVSEHGNLPASMLCRQIAVLHISTHHVTSHLICKVAASIPFCVRFSPCLLVVSVIFFICGPYPYGSVCQCCITTVLFQLCLLFYIVCLLPSKANHSLHLVCSFEVEYVADLDVHVMAILICLLVAITVLLVGVVH